MKLFGECCVEVAFVGLDRKISTPVQVAEMVTLEVILGRVFLQQIDVLRRWAPPNSCASPGTRTLYLLAVDLVRRL